MGRWMVLLFVFLMEGICLDSFLFFIVKTFYKKVKVKVERKLFNSQTFEDVKSLLDLTIF